MDTVDRLRILGDKINTAGWTVQCVYSEHARQHPRWVAVLRSPKGGLIQYSPLPFLSSDTSQDEALTYAGTLVS